MDLLEDLVDVRRVRLDPLLGPLLGTVFGSSGSLGSLYHKSVTRHDQCQVGRELTLAGALDAAAGALEAWEAGALEATDLGAIVIS